MNWIGKLYEKLNEVTNSINLLDTVYEVEDDVLDYFLTYGPGDECSYSDIVNFLANEDYANQFITDVRDLLDELR